MKHIDTFIKEELNPQQQKAVIHENGSVLVIAGAGSGKTRVITARIAHLIANKKVDPNSIIALTFTNKAAGEMKERVASFLDEDTKIPFIGTFHSYCLLLLRKNPKIAPFENFSILDEEDQRTIVKKIIKYHGLEKQIPIPQAVSQISNLKNKLAFSFDEKNFIKPVIRDIYTAYEVERKAARSLDFDDLLLETLKLFFQNSDFKKKFQSKINHILVDEYQDTNLVQHELLKQMTLGNDNKSKSICAVGDEDQSIYSWRGAVVANMLKFDEDFAPVTKIKIEQNYRSVIPILEAANEIIKNNKLRNKKNLWSTRKAKNRILSLSNKSEYQEADNITQFINTLPKSKRNSIAILYRTHFQSRIIEEALTSRGIPYKIIGGIQFYQRKEIKDIIAYLRLIANPFDRVSFFRILNIPSRGIGNKFENIIVEEWEKHPNLNALEFLNTLIEEQSNELTTRRIEALKSFLDVFYGLDKSKSTSFLIKIILEKTAYVGYLKDSYEEQESEAKIENIRELQQSVSYYENSSSNENTKTLENFLHSISLMQEHSDKPKEKSIPPVLLMTLHAAKGLEFDTVIISGLEEGIFPSSRSLNNNESLEEERRLFYVGITRAKERLIISHALGRNTFGQFNEQTASRFLDEIPFNLIQEVNASFLHSSQTSQMFNQWLGTKNQEKEIIFFGTIPSKVKTKAVNKTKFLKEAKKMTNLNNLSNGPWKSNQIVSHKKFGSGIIKKVEKKDGNDYYITAIFKSGIKKLLSSYLKRV
ncbi:UvrD-helicase domain-containing protein [Candidatus Babeliales bacterium]|nr:UvrD-helicase domain-containing protein [Candidatus Babeliales bacterium]